MRNFSCDLIIDNGVYEWSVGHNIGLVILPYEELKPNPDISGIGVFSSFIVAAWFMLIVLILYYILAFRPEHTTLAQNSESSLNQEDDPKKRGNPLDGWLLSAKFVKKVRGHFRRNTSETEGIWLRRETAFNNLILSLGDIQVITGIAIMISGYVSLDRGISMHHWAVIVDLAWCASTTHLGTLAFLQNYFYKHQNGRILRIVLTICLQAMLIVGLLPSLWSPASWRDGSYALCAFEKLYAADNWRMQFNAVAIQVAFLLYGLVSRMFRIVPTLRRTVERAGSFIGKYLTPGFRKDGEEPIYVKTRYRRVFIYWPLKSIQITLVCYIDMISSQFIEIVWVFFSLGLCNARLFTRNMSPMYDDEADWTFGQVLPMILLAFPFKSFTESMLRTRVRTRSNNADVPLSSRPTNNIYHALAYATMPYGRILYPQAGSGAEAFDVIGSPTPSMSQNSGFMTAMTLNRQVYDRRKPPFWIGLYQAQLILGFLLFYVRLLLSFLYVGYKSLDPSSNPYLFLMFVTMTVKPQFLYFYLLVFTEFKPNSQWKQKGRGTGWKVFFCLFMFGFEAMLHCVALLDSIVPSFTALCAMPLVLIGVPALAYALLALRIGMIKLFGL